MQGLNGNQPRPNNNNNKNKTILFVMCIYIFLSLTSKYSKSETSNHLHIQKKIKEEGQTLVLSDMVNAFQLDETYTGKWKKQSAQSSQGSIFMQNQGRFQLKVNHGVSISSMSRYAMAIAIYDGQYIDNLVLTFGFYLSDANFTSVRNNQTLSYVLNNSTELLTQYKEVQILISRQDGQTNITDISVNFQLLNEKLNTNIQLKVFKEGFILHVEGKDNILLKTMILAAILLFISVVVFGSTMKILRGLIDMQDRPQNYSLLTICMTSMLDATLCILSFMFAFSNQDNLMLFIVPAFLLCLLFTSLQPRFMIVIYQQANEHQSIREIICKFNLIHYGSLFLIYPLLFLSNFGWGIFILSCIIYFPQIVINGQRGIRPNINSIFYTRYLPVRFLMILYLKCFPYNVFGLKPDYLLTLICFLLILAQYVLLYVQKIYGPKIVVPRYFFDPVFNYKFEEQINLEEGMQHQCAICLGNLSLQAPSNPNELDFQPSFKLMNTPCNHKYHSRCLMVWMKVKMECPQCRTKLPPYQ